MTRIEILERKVRWAERKANEAAASNETWMSTGYLQMIRSDRSVNEIAAPTESDTQAISC